MPDDIDLTDEQWSQIRSLLPSERGRRARPSYDNRRYFEGMLYVLRAGCPWRELPERYGKWNSVYVRFSRWAEQGIWDTLLPVLVEIRITEGWPRGMANIPIASSSMVLSARGGKIITLLYARAEYLSSSSQWDRSQCPPADH